MTLESVLIVSGVIFAIGLYGALAQRNAIVVLMGIELMFNAVVMAALAFSRFTLPAALAGGRVIVTPEAVRSALSGHVFAVCIIGVAASGLALGLALVIALYRSRETAEITDANLLKN